MVILIYKEDVRVYFLKIFTSFLVGTLLLSIAILLLSLIWRGIGFILGC